MIPNTANRFAPKTGNRQSGKLLILNYHGVDAAPPQYSWQPEDRPYRLSLTEFQAQLDALAEYEFRALSLSELRDWRLGRLPDSKPVLLTFDDGHLCHYEVVAPELERRGLSALFFVSAGLIGEAHQMSRGHLHALQARGFDIGSHGMNHVPLISLKPDELRVEIEGSKARLEELLRKPVTSFSIPRGFDNKQVRAALRSAGYTEIFTSRFGWNDAEPPLVRLRRIALKSGISRQQFEKYLRDETDPSLGFEKVKDFMRERVPFKLYDYFAALKRGRPS